MEPAAAPGGRTLIELVVVLCVFGLCFAAGGTLLARGLAATEARGAAQAWQAAGLAAQTGALWQTASADARYASGHLAVIGAGVGVGAGRLGPAAPNVPSRANIARWRRDDGVEVRFLAVSGAPNSAGSLFFQAPGGDYRVTVRLESGLTVRTRVGATP